MLFESNADGVHVFLGLFNADARLQPRNHSKKAKVPRDAGRKVGVSLPEIPRDPKPDILVRRREIRRHHTNYLVRFIVENDSSAEDRHVAVEAPLPKRI